MDVGCLSPYILVKGGMIMKKRYVAILITITVFITVLIMRIQEDSVREYVTVDKNGDVVYLLLQEEKGKVQALFTTTEKKQTSNKTYTTKQKSMNLSGIKIGDTVSFRVAEGWLGALAGTIMAYEKGSMLHIEHDGEVSVMKRGNRASYEKLVKQMKSRVVSENKQVEQAMKKSPKDHSSVE